MAYAADIITPSFEDTKKLFFPIRLKYWLKMGFVNIFSYSTSNSFGNLNSSNPFRESNQNMTMTQMITEFNNKSLEFLYKYGFIVGLSFFILYFIGLFFVYISSIFSFMFIDGIVKKDIKIKESFRTQKKSGTSFFALRFFIGIINFFVFLLFFYPVIFSFFNNTLSSLNLFSLIPNIILFVIYSIFISTFLFLVNDFTLPIMYKKNLSFFPAWNEFKKIAKKKVWEIVLYALIKFALGIASGIGLFILLIPLSLIYLILLIPFGLIGILIYILFSMLAQFIAIISVIVYGVILLIFSFYLFSVLFVPVSAFFRIYSIKMVEKLKNPS